MSKLVTSRLWCNPWRKLQYSEATSSDEVLHCTAGETPISGPVFSKGWGTGDKGHTPGSCGTLHLSPSPSMRHVRSYCKMCGSWSLQGSCGRELGGGGLVTLWPLSPTPPVSHPRYPPTGSWEKNYSSMIESYCSLWLPRIPYEMSKTTLRGGLWTQRRV